MSSGTYERSRSRPQAACGLCGRLLSEGYYFVCHVCGQCYCYAHMPTKCDHRPDGQLKPIQVS